MGKMIPRPRGRPPQQLTEADKKAIAGCARRFRDLVTDIGWDYARLSRELDRAKRLSVTGSALRKYADGSRPMPFAVATEIAEFFEVRVRWLYHGEEPMAAAFGPSRETQLINKGRAYELARFEEELRRLRVSSVKANLARQFAGELLDRSDLIVTVAVNRRLPDRTGVSRLVVPDTEQPSRRVRWYQEELEALLKRIKDLL